MRLKPFIGAVLIVFALAVGLALRSPSSPPDQHRGAFLNVLNRQYLRDSRYDLFLKTITIRLRNRLHKGRQGNRPRLLLPLKIRPVRVTSKFGPRNGRMHKGIDLDAEKGDDVMAAAAGRVKFAGWKRGYGKIVIIDHRRYETRYAHLSVIRVRKGNWVKAGQVIGDVGMTGNASGSHLHFEIRDQGVPKNPRLFLPRFK